MRSKPRSSASIIDFPLRSRGRSVAFLLALVVPGLFLAVKTAEIAAAATLGKSADAGKILEAVHLDPSNANLHYRLGMAYCYSLDHSQPEKGMSELRQATELDPTQPSYWSALASACESFGDAGCADRATERTLTLAPMAPRFRWDAANRDLAEGHSSAALGQFRRLLQLAPGYAPETFRLCLQLDEDPGNVYQQVLAGQKDPKLDFAYIDYLASHGQGEKAYPVWQATLGLDQQFGFQLAEPYLEWLFGHGHEQEALNAWKGLERHGIIRKSSADTPGNRVFNSGFEEPLLNAGFGWHVHEGSYTRVSLDDSDAYQGQRSLRVDFTVSHNGNYVSLYQIVPVEPDHTYLLQAYARSDDLTSKSGPRLRVIDPDCPSCLNVSTEATLGTTNWHPLSVSFSTGPKTRLVEVALWRPRGLTFPSEISGTFWLDAVSLEQATPSKNEEALKGSS